LISLGIIFVICYIGCSSSVEEINEPQKISAGALIDQISKGSTVAYSNVVISGDLDLTDADLVKDSFLDRPPEIIDSPISITGSIFEGDLILENKTFRMPLIFNNNIFRGNVYFNDSKFTNGVSFNGSTFKSSISFSRTHFFQDICYRGCLFEGNCNFACSSFEKTALFKDTMFLSEATFRGAIFKDDLVFENSSSKNSFLSFYNSTFLKEVHFRRSRFEGQGIQFIEAEFGDSEILGSTFNNSDFSGSNFNGAVKILNGVFNGSSDFSEVIFNRDVAIYGSVFNGDINLKGSKFRGQASFKSSVFNGSAIFDNVEFERRAQFSNTEFYDSAGFNESKFKGDALFEGAVFGGSLFLKRAEYDKMYIRWENITHLNFDDSSFLLLIENFKKLGFWSDADQCYYAYRSERNRFLPLTYRPVDAMLSILYGYGTKPERPLLWFVLTIILFGFIFYRMGGIRKGDKGASIWDSIFFSATNIASGAKALGNFISTPSDFLAVGRFQYLVIIEKFLGMLLFALFLTSLARTVIR